MNNIQNIEDFNNLSEQQRKILMWYFHPDEIVRMLRYFQLSTKLNPQDDMTPHYSNDPNVGVVINTYGNTAFVELQLYYLRNVNNIKKILIHDNCSTQKEQLQKLAKKYNIDFYSTDHVLFSQDGIGSISDQHVFYKGLLWAKQNNIDILVKLNHDLIPCDSWVNDLKQLAKNTDAIAFTSWCEKDNITCRIDGIALNVDIFTRQYPLYNFQLLIENNICVFTQFWLHELIKSLSYQNYSEKWKNYIDTHKLGFKYSGYAYWPYFLGINKHNKNNRDILTLQSTYSTTQDYLNQINKFLPGKYDENDFK